MLPPLRILLVDDEPPCRDVLRAFLEADCPEAIIAGEAGSLAEAIELIPRIRPDLLLLDVHLSDGTGFDLLDRFPSPEFRVIFTTGFDAFALRAFRYSALDYLLKPVDPDLLVEAVRKTGGPSGKQHQQLVQLRHNTATRTLDRITLNTGDGLVFIRTSEIIYLTAHGNYTFVHLTDGERHLVNRPLKEFGDILPEPGFFRIHQSHLVNTGRVKKYLKEDGGLAIMQDGARLSVARRRRDEFLQELGK